MKHCPKCKRDLPVEEFRPNKTRADGLNGNCNGCRKTYMREHYARNKVYYKKKARTHSKATQELITSLKQGPCKDCKQKFHPWQMDFDHIDGVKEFNLGFGRYKGKAKIIAEIAKCELVCANCHRDRTYRRQLNAPTSGTGGDSTKVA